MLNLNLFLDLHNAQSAQKIFKKNKLWKNFWRFADFLENPEISGEYNNPKIK